ncbi:MAG: signal peptidase II [Candidatus Omnitrophota bacterium]
MIFIIVSTILILDRLTKLFFVKSLAVGASIPVIKDFFHFTLVYNRGAAFGMFKDQVPFFILTSAAAIFFILFHLKKSAALEKVALGLILAGAVGNLCDRVFLGYVIDFLDFHVEPFFYWPVFNVADSAITIGACLLGWLLLRQYIPSKR